MENLTLNSLYEVYVYVSDGNMQSKSSSVVTMLAAPGFFIYCLNFILCVFLHFHRVLLVIQTVIVITIICERSTLLLDIIDLFEHLPSFKIVSRSSISTKFEAEKVTRNLIISFRSKSMYKVI